jgi:hypothetical protein
VQLDNDATIRPEAVQMMMTRRLGEIRRGSGRESGASQRGPCTLTFAGCDQEVDIDRRPGVEYRFRV